MNIFQIITLEGWTDMMYIVRDVEQTYAYDAFFTACVVFGSFVILNLMIAVQASYLDKAFDEETNRQKELQEKIELKKKMQQEMEDEMEEDDMEDFAEDQDDGMTPEENSDNGGRRRSNKKMKEKKKGCCEFKKPDWFVKMSDKFEKLCESPQFEKGIIVLILVNTGFLAIDHYDSPQWLIDLSDIANLFFTVVFALEMILKLIGFGFRKYVADGFNIFDAFIVIMSYVELFIPGDDSSLSVLRAFRLLRIFKIIKSWDSLRILLSTVLESLTAITNLGVLIVLYLFISALLTKQFYSGKLHDEDGEESRYNFSTTGEALISVFIILTGENWNEIMIQVMDSQKSMLPSMIFILLMILGNFMLLNLFLAILLKSISEIGNDEEGEKQENQEEQVETQKENNANNELNESGQLNSSNSNIEEEFEQIKAQLVALSSMLNIKDFKNNAAQNDQNQGSEDSFAVSGDDDGSLGRSEKKEEEKQKPVAPLPQAMAIFEEEQEEEQGQDIGSSLYIFSYNNPLRVFLRGFIFNSYFAGFIYHMIALNSLLLILDEPQLSDPYQQKTISMLLLIISIIFVIECVLKIIVQGFWIGKKTYLKDPWNVLDFVIVLFSILTWILEMIKGADISFIRGFRALRALRPLRVVSKNEGKSIFFDLISVSRHQNCGELASAIHSSASQCAAHRPAVPDGVRNPWNSTVQRHAGQMQ